MNESQEKRKLGQMQNSKEHMLTGSALSTENWKLTSVSIQFLK